MRPGRRTAAAAAAAAVLALVAATGLAAQGASPPPNLTGNWANVASPSSPYWELSASSDRATLSGNWHGGAGHETLTGEFRGTLDQAGAYTGTYDVEETVEGARKRFPGSVTVTIQSPSQITINLKGENGGKSEIHFQRVGAVPPERPATTPISTAPGLGVATDYQPPQPGAIGAYPTPPPSKAPKGLAGEITFVDENGHPVAGPPAIAVRAQAEKAYELCSVLLSFEFGSEQESFEGVGFGTCALTVSRVLARAEEIERKKAKAKGADRALSAARACKVLVRGTRKGARSSLSVRCTATATGVKFSIRPRSPHQTLAAALHGHAPKLLVGRSKVNPGPAGLRLNELWRAAR